MPPFSSALSFVTLTSTPPAQDPFSLAAIRRRPSVESCSGWQACGVFRGSRAELLSIELDGSSGVVGRVEDLQDSKMQCPGLECIK